MNNSFLMFYTPKHRSRQHQFSSVHSCVRSEYRKVWPHVTMVTNFLDHNNKGLKKRRRRRQRERKKKQKVKISKTITFHLHYVFLYICNMKLPNFSRPLYGVGERNTHTKNDLVLSYSTPENVVNIWQIKWNRIRSSLKFETVQNHFLSDAVCLLSSIATWHTTSPLCCTRFCAWRNSETS